MTPLASIGVNVCPRAFPCKIQATKKGTKRGALAILRGSKRNGSFHHSRGNEIGIRKERKKERGKKEIGLACVGEREREWEIAEIASLPFGRWVTTEMKNGYDEKMRLFSF